MRVRGRGGFDSPDYVYKAPRAGQTDPAAAAAAPSDRRPRIEEEPFSQKLEDATGRQRKGELEALLSELSEQGKRLAARPTLAALATFKKSVKQFLDGAVSGSYRLKITRSSADAAQQKLYVVVEKVDARLAELSEQVVSGQRDALRILSTVDAVRGLLMDLYT